MEQILQSIPDFIQIIALLVLTLVIFATVVARLTPTKKDDEIIGSIGAWAIKAIRFLPTIGINPSTKQKELELKRAQDAYEALLQKQEEQPKTDSTEGQKDAS